MKPPLLACIAGAAAGAAVSLALVRSPASEARGIGETAVLERRLSDLEREFRRMRESPPPPLASPPERSVRGPALPEAKERGDRGAAEVEDLRARAEALEKAVAGLREIWLRGGAARLFDDLLPPGASAAEIKKVLKGLGYPYPGENNAPRDARISLYERLLREFPDDPASGNLVRDLVSDLLGASNGERARAVLDEHGRRVGIDDVELEVLRAGSYSMERNYEEAKRCHERVLLSADAPEWRRGEARFWIAHETTRQGGLEEALSLFEALIGSYGSDPPAEVRRFVAGARTQVESLRKQLGR